MGRATNQTRFNNEVAMIVTAARTLGVTADQAAATLTHPPTRAAVDKAAQRLTQPDRAAPADPFAGFPQ